MIIWEKSQKKKKILTLLMLVLSPVAFITGYGLKAVGIYSDLVDSPLNYEPDPIDFVDINYTRLAEMVAWTDQRFEQFHMPLNLTTSTIFVDDGTFENIESYRFTDNQALQGGFAIAAFTFKYLAGIRENNLTIQNDALRVLRNLTHGFSMLLRVPNGGLGPEYPGILARGYSPPDPDGIGSYYFQGHPKEANGTGTYSNWRWRGFTSNDEYGGFYLALAVLLKYVDDPYISDLTHLMIEQIANYMVKTNFLVFQQYGGPSGAVQRPKALQGGFWVATVLKMASIVNPEIYEPIYYYWLSSEGVAISNKMSGSLEIVANYFAYTFGYGPVLGFLLLEDSNSPAWKQLFQGYSDSLWSFVKNNRNAYFNAVHLAILASNFGVKKGDYPVMEHDLEDQLMRMDINHFPDRLEPKPFVPDTYQVSEEMLNARRYFTKDPIGRQLAFFFPDVEYEEIWYNQPLSIEFRPSHSFIWEISPFTQEVRYENSLCETAGLNLITPYWIARAYGFISSEGVKLNEF